MRNSLDFTATWRLTTGGCLVAALFYHGRAWRVKARENGPELSFRSRGRLAAARPIRVRAVSGIGCERDASSSVDKSAVSVESGMAASEHYQ
jgi:hypothetical protein